jgi:hypothetical protein
MFNKKILNTKYQILNTFKAGTALLMTVLILNSIILISLAAAKLITSGIKDSGTQSKSTKAYFAAEAGAERELYEYRKTYVCSSPAFSNCHFTKTLPGGSSYDVNYDSGSEDHGDTLIFVSVGNFSGLKRTDQLDFNY